jgi:hypothetical protein
MSMLCQSEPQAGHVAGRFGLIVTLAITHASLLACSDENGNEVEDIRTSRLSVKNTTLQQANQGEGGESAAGDVDESTLIDTFQLTLHPLLLER